MKKMSLIMKNALKALVGSFAMVGVMQVIDIVASVMVGHYIRFDNGATLYDLVRDYISSAIFGYGVGLLYIKYKQLNKDKDKDMVQKVKSLIIIAWFLSIVITIVDGLLTNHLDEFILLPIFSVVFGFILLLIYVIDKKSITEINEKIKEKNN